MTRMQSCPGQWTVLLTKLHKAYLSTYRSPVDQDQNHLSTCRHTEMNVQNKGLGQDSCSKCLSAVQGPSRPILFNIKDVTGSMHEQQKVCGYTV